MLVACLALLGLQTTPIEMREFLTLEPVGSGGRVPIFTNALVSRLVDGTFKAPVAGETFEGLNGQTRTWTLEKAGADGTLSSRAFRGGFAFASVDSESEKVMMLEAAGHSYVYVNGEPRGGDPYSYGFYAVPVLLKKGKNEFLFNVGRGSLRARLVSAKSDKPYVEARDVTVPDLIVGSSGACWGSLVVTNPTTKTIEDAAIVASLPESLAARTPIGPLPPLTSLKYSFQFEVPSNFKPGKVPLVVKLGDSSVTIDLEAKPESELHRRTFVSDVDSSVQYYAVRPPFSGDIKTADALILSVHGAGVEATGQAAAYGAKPWAWVVAPTNRRPFGFDWEDWGRIDAMEALADAKMHYHPKEDRIYLTGHSMGGHGTWIMGATYPDQWAAIGPCSGWISFSTYGGGLRYQNPDPIEAMMLRCTNVSDTAQLLRNYLNQGIYMVHGDADDNVPVSEERKMREYLSAFHKDFDWHEEPGAGHWYDSSPEPGASCLDYGPMMDFFARHRRTLPKEMRRIEFTTMSTSVSSRCGWIEIAQQARALMPSKVIAVQPVGMQRYEVETTNVSLLVIDVEASPVATQGGPFDIVIDGTELHETTTYNGKLILRKVEGAWEAESSIREKEKSPRASGPFRAAFDNRFVLVYGTHGTPEENAWSYAKARYDAETWWMRGNGSAAIQSDKAFLAQQWTHGPNGTVQRRNAIFYGNADSNAAIAQLAGREPRLARSGVTFGQNKMAGDGIGFLIVSPIPNEAPGEDGPNLVGIVGGTGIKGMRATDLLPYFVSGVHYPDVFLFDSTIYTSGSKAVRMVGFFGNDWSIQNGDWAWRD